MSPDDKSASRMVMIVFDETLWVEVEEILSRCQVQGYTLLPRVQGRGQRGGPRLDSAVWPGSNQAVLAAVSDPALCEGLLNALRGLRSSREAAAIRAWSWGVEGEVG